MTHIIESLKPKTKLILLYSLFFLVILYFHVNLSVGWGDDQNYINVSMPNGLFAWVLSFYQTFTSRLFFVLPLPFLLKHIFLWKVINSLIITLTPLTIAKIIGKKDIWIHVVLIAFVSLYPISNMSTAGWIVTFVNYWWPMFFVLVACIPFQKAVRGIRLSPFEWLYFMVFAVAGCNSMELLSIFMFVATLYYFAQQWLTRKTANKQLILMGVVFLLLLLFVMLCPGNAIRSQQQTLEWWPEYLNYSVLEKAYLGMMSTIGIQLKNNRIMMLFSIIVLLYSLEKAEKNKWDKQSSIVFYIALSALVINIVFGPFSNVVAGIFPESVSTNAYLESLLNLNRNYDLVFNVSALGACLLYLLCECYVLFHIGKNLEMVCDTKQFSLLLFSGGFLTSFIMGFTAAVFSGGRRASLYFYFSLITCYVIIYDSLSIKKKRIMTGLLIASAIIMLIFVRELSMFDYITPLLETF